MRTPSFGRTSPLLFLLTFIALLLQCSSLSLAGNTLPQVVALFTISTVNETESRCSSMKLALDHYKIAYVEIVVPKTGIQGTLPLRDADNNPKYFFVVACVGQLSYEYEGKGWLSALTELQWTQLRNYELENSVRRVSFDLYPPIIPGIQLANPSAPGCCDVGIDQTLRWVSNDTLTQLGMDVTVLNPMSFETKSLYHYPAAIGGDTNGTTIQPFLKFDPLPPNYVTESVAAVVVNDEGRQHMMFFMAFASWSATSAYLDDTWIQWGTRNTSYTGYGRKIEDETRNKSNNQNAGEGSDSYFIFNKTTVAYIVILLSLVISFQQF